MAWDYPEALAAIASEEAAGCVAAVFCGHDHFGQYFLDEATGVHHCTFCSPLNKGDEGDAFGLVHVWDDTIESTHMTGSNFCRHAALLLLCDCSAAALLLTVDCSSVHG